jgi:hypothetical protein
MTISSIVVATVLVAGVLVLPSNYVMAGHSSFHINIDIKKIIENSVKSHAEGGAGIGGSGGSGGSVGSTTTDNGGSGGNGGNAAAAAAGSTNTQSIIG